MNEKLDMRRLFADGVGFLREQTRGLLPLMLVAILFSLAIQYFTLFLTSQLLSVSISIASELVLFSSIGVIAYRRAPVGQGGANSGWARGTLSLSLAQALVYFLFTIIIFFMLVLIGITAGIIAGASITGPSEGFADSSEFFELLASLSDTSLVILGVLVVCGGVALLWLAARLILFGIATSLHGQIMIFRTWDWTKGHALRVLIFGVIFAAPIWGWLAIREIATDSEFVLTKEGRDVTGNIGYAFSYLTTTGLHFLFGHAAAIAVYKQLAPEIESYETAFS